ncbi:MAG: tetratricopeptide repeat protein, partial [Planctomycetales bacterium]|nr:tetratricopeptide repeat protein [Planctomycetales bacterium]
LEDRDDRSPADNVRLGVCLYLLGRYNGAIEVLRSADGGALAHYYIARCYESLEQFGKAVEAYEAAAAAGYDAGVCALGCASALRQANEPQRALERLDALSGAVEQTAEYLYQRGATVAALVTNPEEVVALYERAYETDSNHSGALFGLALENDRRGNDATAVELYERAAKRFPTHVGALLNLGILYEDSQRYDAAMSCYRRVLQDYPDHPRARLYAKDSEAGGDMYFDEDEQRRRDRLAQVLGIPVSDFELSVRSRNCLQKINVTTLGDLTAYTEQELLSSKNFGETSLIEIREMLASKGLRLGQFAEQKRREEIVFDPSTMSPDEQALLGRPISDLNLSVRARKCMVRLGITTIGELLRRTPEELLECKNFGVTSLNEVREKLEPHSLKLRGD